MEGAGRVGGIEGGSEGGTWREGRREECGRSREGWEGGRVGGEGMDGEGERKESYKTFPTVDVGGAYPNKLHHCISDSANNKSH